jgi:hypothetical protein
MPKLHVLLIFFVAVLGCTPSKTTLDNPTMNEFWTWFDQNKDSIATAMKSGNEETIRKTLDDVDTHMQQVAPGISFLFGQLDNEYEFVVTAGGDRKHFPNVQSFVDAAPKIAGWKITAFRQPSVASDFRLQIGGIAMGAKDIQFQAFDIADGLAITLYPANMTEDNRDLYSQAAVVILDHLVGEYDAVTKIQSLMVQPPSKAESGVPMRPMTELREFLNQQ